MVQSFNVQRIKGHPACLPKTLNHLYLSVCADITYCKHSFNRMLKQKYDYRTQFFTDTDIERILRNFVG